MIEKKYKSLARLSPKAQEAIGEMLTELSVIESDLILNTSKFVSLLSYCVLSLCITANVLQLKIVRDLKPFSTELLITKLNV